MKIRKKNIYIIGLIVAIIDQLIKFFVIRGMQLEQKIIVIKDIFKIYYVKNTGGAFSMFKNRQLFLILVSVIVLIYIINHIKHSILKERYEIISLGLIVGGLIGNLCDRIIYSSVIDYLSFTIFGHSFAVFNLADIAIVLGVAIYIVNMFRKRG